METRKKINHITAVVLITLISFLMTVGVSCGAKKPSTKPPDEPKSGQMTKKKADQFLQRVEKNNPKRAARLRRLRKNNSAKFRQTVRKALEAGPKKPETATAKDAKAMDYEGKQRRFNQMGWRQQGGSGRGGRFAQMGPFRGGPGRGRQFGQMGWRRGGRPRGEPFVEMRPFRGGPGRGRHFGQMGWRRGGHSRGEPSAEMRPFRGGLGRGQQFGQMGWRRGDHPRGGPFAEMRPFRGEPGRGEQFGWAEQPQPDESDDIWGDDDW